MQYISGRSRVRRIAGRRRWREFQQDGTTAWRLALRQVPAWNAGPWRLIPVAAPRSHDCLLCDGRQAPERFSELLEGGLS